MHGQNYDYRLCSSCLHKKEMKNNKGLTILIRSTRCRYFYAMSRICYEYFVKFFTSTVVTESRTGNTINKASKILMDGVPGTLSFLPIC